MRETKGGEGSLTSLISTGAEPTYTTYARRDLAGNLLETAESATIGERMPDGQRPGSAPATV